MHRTRASKLKGAAEILKAFFLFRITLTKKEKRTYENGDDGGASLFKKLDLSTAIIVA